MRILGGIVMLVLAAIVVAGGIPPALDEDRSVPGFCSPGCVLQQDGAHSVAVTPAPVRHECAAESTRELPPAAPSPAVLVPAVSPDTPRAPPPA